jgi:acetyltransferase-like isoleucine patch superfamily enzyme
VRRALGKLIKILSGCWFFLLGNIFSLFFYKRKYLKGKYFSGKIFGIYAIGWRWAVADCIGRILFERNTGTPWPVSPYIRILNWRNIEFCVDDLVNFQTSGSYFQATDGKIIIGKGSLIASNVGLITTNHDIYDIKNHIGGKDIVLGEECWIGMNVVILPGVVLGPHTTVGAGSIVTKSFPEGYCVIAGNPAKVLKIIDKDEE